MTAEEAYEKTEKVLEAYANGDLLGGNPMCHIEAFARQELESYQQKLRAKIEEAVDEASKWPLETNSKAAALSRLKWVLSLLPPYD